MNGYKIVLLKAIFMLYKLLESERVCSGICTVGLEHTAADWYFLANLGEGWDWLFQFDPKAQNLYVATTDSMSSITDRYDIYHFNGMDFVYQKTGAPFCKYSANYRY